MAKYPNQRTIIINKEKINELGDRLFFRCYQDNVIKAATELGGVAFKIYILLSSFKHKYQFDYSPAYISKTLGIGEDSAKKAFKELKEKNFLILINEKETLFNFYESENIINSKGEENILNLLQKHNFKFLYDTPYFKDCMGDKFPLRYDFILFNEEELPWRLIEFDGPQHLKNTFNDEEAFKKIQKYDKIKNEYALNHNIPLVRIPYKERDNITIDLLLGDKYLIKGDNSEKN